MKWINQHVTIQSLFQVIKEGIWSYSVYFPFKQLKRTSIEFKWSSFVIQATKLCASCHLLLLTARIYSGTPLNTDTYLLRTVFLVPRLIFPRNSTHLIRTLFIAPLASIKWFGCKWIDTFQVLMRCMQKPPKNYGKCCLMEFFLIALSSSYLYTSILCITWWQNPFKLETQIPTCLLRSTSFLISVGRIPGSKSGSGNSTTSFSSACRNRINYFSNLRHYRKSQGFLEKWSPKRACAYC